MTILDSRSDSFCGIIRNYAETIYAVGFFLTQRIDGFAVCKIGSFAAIEGNNRPARKFELACYCFGLFFLRRLAHTFVKIVAQLFHM